ncbi:MAG: ankyrin repeat domain-containing protein, partial [Candidatus Amoebophilus sp.]
EYDDKVDRSKLISSYQDEEALKTSIVEAIEEFQASIEKLEKEEKAWNNAIAPLGNVKELAGYMNSPNEAGNYLLHMWAEKEPIDIKAGKFILKRTSDINRINRAGKTALQLAIDAANVDKVNLLLKHKADVNIAFPDGKSPLLYTLEKEEQGKHALTEALLKAGANPNIVLDTKGLMPLHVALQNKDLDKVNLLLKHKADVNIKFADGKSPLLYTLEKEEQGKHALTEALLKAGASPNIALDIKGLTPLHVALQNKDLDKLILLLKHKSDVNVKFADGKSPLLYTLEKEEQGKHALTEALLKAGASPNIALDTKGLMPLHVALQNKDLDKITLLLKHKADVNIAFPDGRTPLLYVLEAIGEEEGESELIEALLKHGADVNVKFADGRTALLYVIEELEEEGEYKRTEALLKHGANPNIALDSKGLMPLHIALKEGDVEKVILLLKHKANANIKFPSGETSLAYVIKNTTGIQRENLVRILIQHGADQNALEIEKFLSVIEKLSKDLSEYLTKGVKERDYTTLKLLLTQAQGHINHFEKTLGSVVSGPKILGGALGKEIGEALNKIIDKAIPMLRKELIRAREEYKAWHEAIKNSFGVNTDKEVEKYIRYLYHSTQEGNALIHMWAGIDNYNEPAGRFILERTVDINLKNKEGFTPLHLAIRKKNLANFKLLLEYNASPSIEFPDKSGPLVYVVDENYKDADKYGAELLAHGAKVHEKYPASRSSKYKPILMGVIMNDKLTSEVKTALVRSLVKHGVNRDEHMEDGGYSKYFNDMYGWTPLYAAMERGEVDICAILLEDIFPNLYPKTPVVWYDNHKWWITPRFIIRQGEERGIYMSGR